MSFKWFWGTLSFWLAFGTAVSTWALIFSPMRLSSNQTVNLEGLVNGLRQIQELRLVQAPLCRVLTENTALWKKDGWKTKSGPINLASLLMELGGSETLFSSFIHVSLFEKNGTFRVLGLWEEPGQTRTYEWIAEISKNTFEPSAVGSRWNFPLKPPKEALNLFTGEVNNLQIAGWCWLDQTGGEALLSKTASAQNFAQTPWSQSQIDKTCFLKKNSQTIMAVLNSAGGLTRVSLFKVVN